MIYLSINIVIKYTISNTSEGGRNWFGGTTDASPIRSGRGPGHGGEQISGSPSLQHPDENSTATSALQKFYPDTPTTEFGAQATYYRILP
jgi:hypothetical protein